MIRNNFQVKDKYKSRINKGKKNQKNLKDTLKGITLTAEALYICGVAVLGEEIWENKKEKQRKKYNKHPTVFRNAAKSY